jgi:hypothetical protein
MAEDSFLHLARPLGPVSVGTAPTTAPLNVVIQPQVRLKGDHIYSTQKWSLTFPSCFDIGYFLDSRPLAAPQRRSGTCHRYPAGNTIRGWR